MKPTRDTYTVESNLGEGAEAVAMTIDPGAMQHIMGILTELYSDPEMAVVREYATNARDAHVAAGTSAPIRVELPTDLRPFLIVRDEGVGLDAPDIRAIYSQYGASTKRDSDEATGMLGLGCKSALAYADQFTLIGRKDGRQVTVVVSRDESGAGVMNLLDERDTSEPNGVEVQIPARRGNAFAAKAAALFRFWPEGSVLVNGEAPERIGGYELSPVMRVVDKGELDGERCVIVMGGVPYPAPGFFAEEETTLAYHKALVIWVEIGAVHFAPSREALMDTPTTRRTMEALRTEYNANKNTALDSAGAGATTRGEAVARQIDVQDALDIQRTATWRGEEVPAEVVKPDTKLDDWWYLPDTSRYYRASRSTHMRERKLIMKVASRAIWVLGFGNRTWTATMRDKLDRYCGPDGPASDVGAEQGGVEFVLTSASELPSPWLSEVRTIEWGDIRDWKDPSAPSVTSSARSYAGTYCTWVDGAVKRKYEGAALAADEADGERIFWTVGSTAAWEEDGGNDASALRAHFGPGTRLVVLPRPRVAKFLRTFPEATEAVEGRREAAETWMRGLSVVQRNAIATHADGYYRHLAPGCYAFDTQLARDPRFAIWNRTAAAWTSELFEGWQLHRRHAPDRLRGVRVPDPGKDYPLAIKASDEPDTLHELAYVNMIYREESQ